MNNRLAFFLFAISFLVLCACGQESQKELAIENDQEVVENQITEDDSEEIIRPVENYVIDEPRVKSKDVYEEGEWKKTFEYEYDEKGRYRAIYYYEVDDRNEEKQLICREEYSYDEYLCFVKTTYSEESGQDYKEVFDSHGNMILHEEDDDASLVSYYYRYPRDTEQIQEKYCYKGEGMLFYLHELQLFNEHGDEVKCTTEYKDGLMERATDYVYDIDGNITNKSRTTVYSDIMMEFSILAETTYDYGEEGELLHQEENTFSADESGSYREERRFEYDELLRKSKETIIEEQVIDYVSQGEKTTEIYYKYESDNVLNKVKAGIYGRRKTNQHG